MRQNELKEFLDSKVEQYNHPRFIESDPIQVPHQFTMKEDIEIVLEQVALFVSKIKNWSHCDSFCTDLKIVRKHKERVWKFIKSYWQ